MVTFVTLIYVSNKNFPLELIEQSKAQMDEQTEMLIIKSEQNQTLENQIVSQTNEIDSLKEDIRQKMEEFQASDSISQQQLVKLETEISSKTVEFSDSIEKLQDDMKQISDENVRVIQENSDLTTRISELEETEIEKQKLSEKMVALRNKAKVSVKMCTIRNFRADRSFSNEF